MRKVLYLFSKFIDQDIDWFVRQGTKECVEEGQVLIEEGKKIETIYITLAGNFHVTKSGKTIAEIGSGEVLGELSLLDNRAPNVSVVSIEKSILLAISVKKVVSKLRVDTGFASRFYWALGVLLANRMRETVENMAVGSLTLNESIEEFNEIDNDFLDDTSLAAARFERMREAVLLVE